jgi:hypothetical protein
MTAEIDDNEPVPKLTAKLRSEIMPPQPFEYTVLKPAESIVKNKEESTTGLEPAKTIIEPEDEERFEETMETPKVKERKSPRERVKRSKVSPSESKSISRLHTELRKHSDANKKTNSAILDIRKELKDLLLIHHATIKELQKQVAQMRRKFATIENSRKTTNVKISAMKISTGNKNSSNKKSIKKSSQKKSRKR